LVITKSTLAVGAAYAVLTVAMTWPLVLRAATHQLGGGVDPWLFVWTVGWNVHALTTAPWAIFDANIFYPHANTLAYSEHLIGTVLVAAPVIWATGNPLLGTNMAALASVFLCAAGGYFLARRLGLSRPAAFLCGLIFAFTPPRFGRIYQLHQTAIYFVPFALGFLHTYLRDGRARDLRWAAAMFSLQALTSGHGAALLILGAAMMIAYRLLAGEPVAARKRLRDAGVPGLLLLAPSALMFIPYWRTAPRPPTSGSSGRSTMWGWRDRAGWRPRRTWTCGWWRGCRDGRGSRRRPTCCCSRACSCWRSRPRHVPGAGGRRSSGCSSRCCS
jgi:hypothetical protein